MVRSIPKKAGHVPGRGCLCAFCVGRREKAKQRYHDKKNGISSPAPKLGQPAVPQSSKLGRLFEHQSGESLVVHWMPGTGEEWTCPHCGQQFFRVGGKWESAAAGVAS